MDLRKEIVELCERYNVSQVALSRLLGVPQPQINRLFKGQRKIAAHEYKVAKDFLGSLEVLLGEDDNPFSRFGVSDLLEAAGAPPEGGVSSADYKKWLNGVVSAYRAEEFAVGAEGRWMREEAGSSVRAGLDPVTNGRSVNVSSNMRDHLPFYGQVICGDGDQFEMSERIVDRRPCPWGLQGVPNAYALYIEGRSMYPRYKEGEVVYVHPGKKPKIEDDVVVHLKSNKAGGAILSFIREYQGGDSASIKLRQYGEAPKDLEVSRDQVDSVHVIVGRE